MPPTIDIDFPVSRRTRIASPWRRLAATLAALACTSPALATTYTVGASAGCTHSTIAAALTAAENNAGADTIRIARDTSWMQQAVSLTTSQELTITGGFATCNGSEDDTYTTIDGAGGAAAPVFRITGNTGSLIRVRKLTITHGDVSGSGRGGGIYYTGDGILDVGDTTVNFNEAGYGGGIAALATGLNAELILRANTTIGFNTAHYNGGGLHLEDIESIIREDNTLIYFNDAQSLGGSGGYGGGVTVRACNRSSVLYLGSPGVAGLGVIYSNTARYGAGIAMDGGNNCDHSKTAELRMFSTDAQRLTKLEGNVASVAGGGLYLNVDSGPTFARAFVWNASIVGNEAPQGAAMQLDSEGDVASSVRFNTVDPAAPDRPDGAVDCAIGAPCGRISDNLSSDTGRVISGVSGNGVELRRVELSGNHGSQLVRLESTDIANALIVDNEVTARLIQTATLFIHGTTIAGNSIGGAEVLGVDNAPDLDGLILWQPGKTALSYGGDIDFNHVHDILSNEIGSLFDLTPNHLLNQDPRFVDPAHGDYNLTAASPAVDFSDVFSADNADLLSHPRNTDLSLVPDRYGPRDLGALEREVLQPIVLNSDFQTDLNLWAPWDPSESVWDPDENGSGAAGSGSLHIRKSGTATGDVVHPRVQCVHVPGPGIYALNAWGRSTGTQAISRDTVSLLWQYRRYGDYTENCFAGDPTRTGEIEITKSTTWTQGANPAYIEVPVNEWTRFTTILVFPGVRENDISVAGNPSINAWVDGITLTPVDSIPGGDTIFANGFEGS